MSFLGTSDLFALLDGAGKQPFSPKQKKDISSTESKAYSNFRKKKNIESYEFLLMMIFVFAGTMM